MRKAFAWLGIAMLVGLWSATAHAGDPLKPYVVLILDTSGSMNASTGSGPPSCGGGDTRLEHATCAINRIVNSYGDMVFALGRFRETTSGTFTNSCDANGNINGNQSQTLPNASGGDQCNTQGPFCGSCNPNTGEGYFCNSDNDCWGSCINNRCSGYGQCTTSDRELEMISGLVDGNNEIAANVTDRTCGSCSMPSAGTATSSNEIWGVSPNTFTPLAAVLNGAKSYWSGAPLASDGTTVIWPSNAPGFAPIFNDPTKLSFLPGSCNPSPTCTTNCCASQCRPYVTILLTDGAETCTSFSNTTSAAASLLGTDIQGRRYRIETKPIGFGISPGNAQIEGIAHAGGAADLPGNEGYYASDEQGLQLAISSILADAIKSEVCNNLDDDCDTLVDEDFPGKGGACTNGEAGICRVEGAQQCRADGVGLRCDAAAVLPCTNPGSNGQACSVVNATGATVAGTCQAGLCDPTPQTEVCNTLDDDCDGKIDEGLSNCTCSPQAEACDNDDDDCDGRIDEGITRPCGTGTCQGVETCTNGAFGGCTADTPETEVCNGLDDNCDGIRDGFNQACSTMPPLPPESFPIDDPRNNPGHPSNNPIPENICQPGTKVCPANVGPPNAFGACQGEIKPCNGATPCADLCNGLDDDCDNLIDEDFAPADCSTNCGVGQTSCVNGTIQCNTTAAMDDTTCNGIDDDCDNLIDEDWMSSGMCGQGQVCNGMEQCINGMEVCVGDTIGQESCNCDDDDCDNLVDEGTLCPPGATCSNCQCAFPCAEGEFPCPLGKICQNNFCIADVCFGVTCPNVNGNKQECVPDPNGPDGRTCVDACSIANCASFEACIPTTGECKPDNCTTFPEYCTASQNCVAGECITDACKGVTCPGGEYCVGGQCFGSCAGVECPDGQRCKMGICEADPCGGPCPYGQVCIEADGQCKTDPCGQITCPQGQACDPQTVTCETDPCLGVTCPNAGEVCKYGTCFDAAAFQPDAPIEEHVTTGGGGGCATGGDGSGLLVALALLGLARTRRRRAATGGAA